MDAELGFPHTVLSYLSRPPGYKKFLQVLGKSKDGENLLTRNWDLCIVLDACRADLLQSVLEEEAWSPPEEWSWNTITSVDSHTIPWSRKTFLGPVSGETTPTTYVTATPQSTEVSDSDRIAELDEVWRYAWDDTLGTVPPGAVTDRAIHHYRTGSNRVLAHYLQPHVPLLTRDDEALRPYFGASEGQPNDGAVTPQSESDDGASDTATVFEWLPGEWDLATGDSTYLFDRLRGGQVDRQTAWKGYRETLLIALEEVTALLRSVDAETVVITADHGNAFGEWGLFGHPYHMPVSVLRTAPYVTTSATAEIDHEPAEYETDTNISREKQLEALGYR